MTSMNEHMNACSWYQSEKQRGNPNLACQRQTNTKQGKRDLESIKMGQTKACDNLDVQCLTTFNILTKVCDNLDALTRNFW